MVAWFLTLLVASLLFAVLVAAKRPGNPLAGPSYFDRHPTVVLGILATAVAIVVFPVFFIASLPVRLYRSASRRLASGTR